MFYLEILSNAFIFSSHFHPGECLAQSFVCDWVARHQVLVSPLCMPLYPGCTHWCVFLPQAVKQVYLHFWLEQCSCICMKEKMSGVVVGHTRQCKRVASQHVN